MTVVQVSSRKLFQTGMAIQRAQQYSSEYIDSYEFSVSCHNSPELHPVGVSIDRQSAATDRKR